MNHEQETGTAGRVGLSPKERLEEAIRDYLAACERPEDNLLPNGVLTSWVLLTEEQDVISGQSANMPIVRDHQSPTLTLGLISYADEVYRSRIRRA